MDAIDKALFVIGHRRDGSPIHSIAGGAIDLGALDPIEPQVDINDYIRLQTQRIGSDTVTWASGTNTPASKPRSSFVLPKVGIAARILLDFEGTYDLTIGAGTAAIAADGRGPWQIVDRLQLSVNGAAAWYNVSGFGSYLLNALEEEHAFPQDVPGTAYTTAPRDVASDVFEYPVAADGTARFGIEIPLILRPDNPLGMLLLQNDQTTVSLDVVWGALDAYAALAGGAVATLSTTVTATLEYFDVPPREAFMSFFVPMLRWGHWFNEDSQTIAAQGRDSNIVTLDNHDTYLKVIHTLILNGTVNTDNVDDVRLVLNRNTFLYDHPARTQFRRQRRQQSKDLPALVWNLFARGRLRDALHADLYTDVRSVIDVSGATLGTNPRIITTTEKLIDLGLPGSIG